MNTPFRSEDRPARILVVDDSKSVRFALQTNLVEAGFDVVLGVDGEDGLNRALNEDFDLIVTDIDMPKMDGIELCSRLKAEFKTSHIPIIVLSTRDSDKQIEDGFRVGADAYLSKAGDMQENIGRIKDVLQARSFLTGSRILVADDSSSIRLFLKAELSKEGFIVETVADGKQALDRVPDFKPDLIISDLMMPEMDGSDLCRALKKDERFSRIPIIIMSTLSDKPLMRRLMREGAATFLVKPFSVAQLSIVIEEIFFIKLPAAP